MPVVTRPEIYRLGNQISLRIVHFARGTFPSAAAHKSIQAENRLFSVTANPGNAGNYIADSASCHPLVPGTAYLTPAFHPTRWSLDEGLRFVSIKFHLELFSGIDLLTRWNRVEAVELQRSIRELDSRFDADNPIALAMAIRRYVYEVLEHLLWRDGTLFDATRRFVAYRAAFDYFEAHCSAATRIPDMARIMGWTRETFTRRFRADIGVSPARYFARRLAQKAGELLCCPDATLKSVAHELSFSDAFALSHFFKRHMGCSPRDYKRNFNLMADV